MMSMTPRMSMTPKTQKIPMSNDNGNALLDLCEKGVKKALVAGAEETEISMMQGDGFSLSIQNNAVNSSSGGTGFGIAIRVLRNRRPGFAYCTHAGELDRAIEQAISSSSLGKETDMHFPGQPQGWPDAGSLFDPGLAALSPEDGVEMLTGMVKAVTAMDPDVNVTGGGIGVGTDRFALANSRGLSILTESTDISGSIYAVCRKGDDVSTGFESDFSYRNDLDLPAIGETAARLALDSLHGRRIEGGTMPVVFTPDALSNLVEFIIVPAFLGSRAHRGESVYSDRMGDMVVHPGLSIYDDGLLPGGRNTSPSDDEGVPSRRVDLVADGELRSYLYDLGAAAEYGKESTSSGMRAGGLASGRSFKIPVETHSRNFTIQGRNPGNGKEDVLAEIDRGVLVHEILGAHTANPASGDFSVNSSTLFYIENGEIAYPVKQAMLSGNFPAALEKMIAIGNDLKAMGGGLSPNGMNLPTLALDGIRVTG